MSQLVHVMITVEYNCGKLDEREDRNVTNKHYPNYCQLLLTNSNNVFRSVKLLTIIKGIATLEITGIILFLYR